MTAPTTSAQTVPPSASLAAAEFAFAAHSVATNMRDAFLAVMDDKSLLFRPGPVPARAGLAGNPPPPIELNWRPTFVHVAASGDVGYSTGPWRILSKTDPKLPPRYGQFISVWVKQPDGKWILHVDLGVSHPQPSLSDAWLESSDGQPGPGAAAFEAAEKAFADTGEKQGYGAALARFAAADVRVYRNGTAPMLGKATLATAEFGAAGQAQEIVTSGVASSGDLAWAVVKLAPRLPDGKLDAPVAHTVRVWRARGATFELVLDVRSEMS